MNEFLSGIAKIAIGGYILVFFGQIAIRSLWDSKIRDEFLSSPYVRNPNMVHKFGFAALAIAFIGFAAALLVSGLSNLGRAFF